MRDDPLHIPAADLRRWALAQIMTCLSFLIPLAACGAPPDERKVKETQTGLASFYSRSLHGERTASGEKFNNNEMVAAHPTYPFGTIVRVTNLKKGGTIEVRVIDRGPTKKNRAEGVIIDLSRAAAEKLRMTRDGRTRVKVEVLEWGKSEREVQ
jgi:rare lipoprotein A